MKSRLWVTALAPFLVIGCGGSGGGSGGNNDALFSGPLMFVGAQMRIYSASNLQLADFNGDDFPELLYEDEDDGSNPRTTFLPGSETELFGVEQFPGIGFNSVVEDFDGDGSLDIFSGVAYDTTRRGSTVDWSFVRGNGDNTFADPVPLNLNDVVPVGEIGLGDIVTGDINGDEFEDLLALGYAGVTPLVNQGDATFVAAPVVSMNNVEIATADLNGDTFDDIIGFSFIEAGVVRINLSLGDGTFGAVQTAVTADAVFESPVADLNQDDNVDFIGYSAEEGILVFLSQGDATFSSAVATQVTPAFEAAFTRAIADFNGDSIPDLVFTAAVPVVRGQLLNRTYLSLGQGDGTFGPSPTPIDDGGFEILDALTMDVDRDDNLDLLIALNDGGLFLRPIFGNGDGTFRAEAPQQFEVRPAAVLFREVTSVGQDSTRSVDLNEDGNLDLVVVDGIRNSMTAFFGNGDLTFQPERLYPLNFVLPWLSVDLDVDGDVDIFGRTSLLNNWYGILRNYGGGDLGALSPIVLAGSEDIILEVTDFDLDGLPDLAFDFANEDLGVAYGLGDMQFGPIVASTTPGGGFRETVADVTGDGYPDVVGMTQPSDQTARLHVVPGGPGRAFGAEMITEFTFPGMDAKLDEGLTETADFNGDGRADVVWIAATVDSGDILGVIKLFTGQADGTFAEYQDIFIPNFVSDAIAVDLDDDADLDLVLAGRSLDDLIAFGVPTKVRLHCFLNDASGEFLYSDGLHFIVGEFFESRFAVDVTDVNADNYPDAISYAPRTGLAVALGRGDGTFKRPNYFRIGGGMESLDFPPEPIIGDFDNDTDADFAVMWAAGGSIEFAENRMVQP